MMHEDWFVDALLQLTGERNWRIAAAKLAERELQQLDRRWRENLKPVPIFDIAMQHNISPLQRYTEYGPSARLIEENGFRVIEVNLSVNRGRRQFSVAHEIGHAIIGDASERGIHATDVRLEGFCDEFASRLILPDNLLVSWFQRHNGVISIGSIESGADELAVSILAFVKRLGESDLTDKAERAAIVSRFDVKRKRRTDFALRSFVVAVPSWGFVPNNRSLRSMEFDTGIRAFEELSNGNSHEIRCCEGSLRVQMRPGGKTFVLETNIEHKIYRPSDRPFLLSAFDWPQPPIPRA